MLFPKITITVPIVQVRPMKNPQDLSEKESDAIFTALINAGAAPIPMRILPHCANAGEVVCVNKYCPARHIPKADKINQRTPILSKRAPNGIWRQL